MSETVASKKIEAALFRYRIAAYVVGTMLVAACVGSLIMMSFHSVWPLWMLHGYCYMVYLGLAFDFYRRTRWPLPRLAEMIVAGLLPGLTFVIERRVAAYAVVRGIGS